jgi:hypothetical protein
MTISRKVLGQSLSASLAVAMMSVAFIGCGSDNNGNGSGNPGAAAGYAADGSNTCSDALIGDIKQLVRDYESMNQDADSLQQKVQNGETVSRPEVNNLKAEIHTVRDEAAAIQQNYAGVSCQFTNNGKSIQVDTSKMSEVVNACDQALTLIDKDVNGGGDNNEYAPHERAAVSIDSLLSTPEGDVIDMHTVADLLLN